jgi:glycosyltransferase involved in cell wall biosynthesis
MNDPLISIITVVYNNVNTLEQTILSVINQTYKNIEYIIIDGGSTDGTVDIIKKYEDKLTYWVSEPDRGIYDAMNKGIYKATGEWIYFLGSDDILLDILDKIIFNFKKINEIYYGNVCFKYSSIIYDGKFTKLKLAIKNISHQAIFYPKHLLVRMPFDLNFTVYSDYYTNIKLWGGGFCFVYVKNIIAIYNESDGFSAINRKDLFIKNKESIVHEHLGFYCYLVIITKQIIYNVLKYLQIK